MRTTFTVLLVSLLMQAFSQVIFTPNITALQRKGGETDSLEKYHKFLIEYKLGVNKDADDYRQLKIAARREINNLDFFPLRDLPYASIYFQPDSDKIYTNTVISALANKPTYYTEVAYDYLGAFRVSLAASSTVIDSAITTDTANNIGQYFQNPGTAILRADMPLILFTTVSPKKGSYIGLYFSSKLVADVPGAGNTFTSAKGAWDNGVELQLKATGDSNKFRFVGIIRTGVIQGFNNKFTELGTEEDRLWYCTSSIGLGIEGITFLINNPIGGFIAQDMNAKIAPTISTNINVFEYLFGK